MIRKLLCKVFGHRWEMSAFSKPSVLQFNTSSHQIEPVVVLCERCGLKKKGWKDTCFGSFFDEELPLER